MAQPETLKHTELMTQQGLKKTDLPKEIQSQIQGLSLQVGKYNANPDDKKKEAITTKDLTIANAILDWISGGKKAASAPAPVVPLAPTPEQIAAEEAKKQQAIDDAKALEEQKLAQAAADKKANDEKSFLEKLKAQGGRIHKSDIAIVLGKDPSTEETVAGVPLRKIHLGDGYYKMV